jgi:hypothetical protein
MRKATMKLRIKGNSIRIRLSKTEVNELCAGTSLSDNTNFGNNSFGYSVQPVNDGDSLTAIYDNGLITLFVPQSLLADWPVNSVVGFESVMALNNSDQLHLLLEKDFKCLDKTMEDQSDFFENPEKSC